MSNNAAEWGAMATAALAVLGWVRTVSRFSSRLDGAEKDISALQAKAERNALKADVRDDVCELSDEIERLSDRLEKMDNRRESARTEIGEFRERISRELGEIRTALLPAPGLTIRQKPDRD